MNIDLGNADNSVELEVWFKAIDGPPETVRTSDYLNDIGSAVGHKVHHVELRVTNGDVYSVDTKSGVVCKPDKDHAIVTNESFWLGFKVRVPVSEANRVHEFCKTSQGQEYSFGDLIRGYFGGCCLASRRTSDLQAKHTCTSLCFEALAQSDTFCAVLAECDEGFRRRQPRDAAIFTCNPQDFLVYLERMVAWCSQVEEHSGVVTKHVFSCDKNRVADIEYYERANARQRRRDKEYDSFSSSSGDEGAFF